MTGDAAFVGAYWGSRGMSLEHCTANLTDCLVALAHIDSSFARWHEKGFTPSEARQKPVTVGRETLEALLLAGRIRRDQDHTVITELGYGTDLWNGQGERPASFSVTCGAEPSVAGLGNHFFLDWSSDASQFAGEASAQGPTTVGWAALDAVVRAWQPDWATWSSRRIRALQDVGNREPVFGWITYLATGQVVLDASDIARVSLAHGGRLYEIHDPFGPGATERIVELSRRFEARGQ